MSEIVLCTLNARYIHASLGLRSLRANLGALKPRSIIREFVIHDRPADVVERLLAANPRIVGLGIYVWNAEASLQVVELLKKVAPQVVVVLGGPEVRYEQSSQRICQLADYVVAGEGDLVFRSLCEQLLAGERPNTRLISAEPPSLDQLALPYDEYSTDDLQHRVLYVEASRGCPYRCEFCLSSMDEGVRRFELSAFLRALESLVDKGARHFKFVDRTFNLDLAVTRTILEFFLARVDVGLFAHFELVPDRLPEALRALVARFPEGALQFEVGIQTWDSATAQRISRRQDYAKTEENLRFLRDHTRVHLHTDLIAGLPGEDEPTFAAGFDRLVGLGPHEIQVGILKRLRGTPIIRHDAAWGMLYADAPPYEVLQTRVLDFRQVQHLKRFARAYDLLCNSGRYPSLARAVLSLEASPYASFSRFTRWLHAEVGDFTGLSPQRLSELTARFLVSAGVTPTQAQTLAAGDAEGRALAAAALRERSKATRRQHQHAGQTQ